MEEKKIEERLLENRFTSANALSEREFSEEIQKAEKGSFHSVQESMIIFESWLKKRKKK